MLESLKQLWDDCFLRDFDAIDTRTGDVVNTQCIRAHSLAEAREIALVVTGVPDEFLLVYDAFTDAM